MEIIKSETEEFALRASLHPRFLAGIDAVKNLLKYRGNKPYGVMIIGEPGCGKSFLLETVQRMYPELVTRRKTEISMISIDSPPDITTSALYSDILDELGDPCPDEGRPKALRRRMKRLLKSLKTKLLAIDEAHDFLPSSGLTPTSKAVKTIKWIMNNTRIPLVLAGQPDTKDLLDNDDQLKSRFIEVIELCHFSCATEEQALDSADFFDGLFSVFPRKLIGMEFLDEVYLEENGEPIFQTNENFNNLLRLVIATEGNPRRINMLLMDVIESTNPDDELNISDFAESWERVLKSKVEFNLNPFTADKKDVIKIAKKSGLYEAW